MEERAKPTEVVIVDVEIPFASMIVLMVKFAIAAIPAAMVIIFVYMLLAGFLGAAFHH